jgi:hypothetical protein
MLAGNAFSEVNTSFMAELGLYETLSFDKDGAYYF